MSSSFDAAKSLYDGVAQIFMTDSDAHVYFEYSQGTILGLNIGNKKSEAQLRFAFVLLTFGLRGANLK